MDPVFLYHKDKAPDGKVFRDALPTEEGWVDTPAKFDPNYVEPEPVVASGTVPAAAARRGYVPQPYPSMRYNAAGDERKVKNPDEDLQLNPRDWKHSPADFHTAPGEAPITGSGSAKADDPNTSGQAAGSGREPSETSGDETSKQRAAFYKATVTEIAARIEQMNDAVMVETLRAYELSNPKGPRAGVIAAVDKRAKILNPPPTPAA